jgi:hypothetical protein
MNRPFLIRETLNLEQGKTDTTGIAEIRQRSGWRRALPAQGQAAFA